MEKVLGKVMIVWKYGWDASTEYEKLDAVSYNGNSCICVQDNTPIGTTPITPPYWDYLAKASTVNPEEIKQIVNQMLAERGV